MKICDYTVPELQFILKNANFTETETAVFMAFSCGDTIEMAADRCNMGVSTIKRIKSRIRAKIERIENL